MINSQLDFVENLGKRIKEFAVVKCEFVFFSDIPL